jgi:1-acyl-sn-glycerol-3-phosphate acyltransferase
VDVGDGDALGHHHAGGFIVAARCALYWMAARWLGWAIGGARVILGIEHRITGWDNLPLGEKSPAILLVKHQSTYETFLMPTIMPHPLAYVFKKELLYVPFFGWAMGRLDMIHIDRSQRAQAFNKVVSRASGCWRKGVWVIMFPEGTRIRAAKKAPTRAAARAWPSKPARR